MRDIYSYPIPPNLSRLPQSPCLCDGSSRISEMPQNMAGLRLLLLQAALCVALVWAIPEQTHSAFHGSDGLSIMWYTASATPTSTGMLTHISQKWTIVCGRTHLC
jgi:hypothetical protein